jgi:flagellar protein FliO/FliZ
MENAMDFGSLLYRVLGSLGVVLAILFAAVHGFRRFGQFPGKTRTNSRIRLLARQSVGPKHHLIMVEAADRLLLLGVSPDGIRLLSPLGRVDRPVKETASSEEPAEPEQDFQDILQQMTSANA